MKIYFRFLVLFSMVLFSCHDDIIEETETTIIYPEPTTFVSGTISGIVTDSEGTAIQDVTIITESGVLQSDQNGYFRFTHEKINGEGAMLKFVKQGYFENYKFVLPIAGEQAFIRTQIIEKQKTGSFQTDSGGEVGLNGGASVSFPPDAIVRSNNQNFNGQVIVYAHWYDPVSDNFTTSMPGDLRALNADNKIVQLASYGMIAIQLESPSGEKLQLQEGKSAILEFPVPDELRADAPAEIKLWFLDESTGYWNEEGMAQFSNGKYIASVDHFSFWNCDDPFDVVRIDGRLVDDKGNPLSFQSICIQAFNNAITGYGYTSNNGFFGGFVPKDEELTFLVKDDCNNIIHEEIIGPFADTESLGQIEIELQEALVISGRLVDCQGEPVTDGYVKIELTNVMNFYILPVDDSGSFLLEFPRCDFPEIKIQGFDLNNQLSSEIFEYNTAGNSIIDIGDLSICNTLDEFIELKLESGESYVYLDPEARIVGNKFILTNASNAPAGESFNALILDITPGINENPVSFSFSFMESNLTYRAFCGGIGGPPQCNGLVFEIEELGAVGQYIEGKYTGSFNVLPNNNPTEIMGSFRVKLDEHIKFGSISGSVWHDENENGTREAGEGEVNIEEIRLLNANQVLKEKRTNSSSFEFEVIEGGYYLEVISNIASLSPLNIGMNEDLDSDFDPATKQTELIQVNEGEEIKNIDLGIYYSSLAVNLSVFPIGCFGNSSGEIHINILNGQNPFEITILKDGNPYLFENSNENEIILTGFEPGNYTIKITDQQSWSFYDNFAIPASGPLCTISGTNTTCGQNNGEATVSVSGGSGPYNYLWSNNVISPRITHLSAGSYSVTVTDSNGCTTTCSVFISISGSPDCSINFTNPECGVSNGTMTVYASGGSGGYSYQWTNGATTKTITGLSQGTYSVTIYDTNGCTTSCSETLEYEGGEDSVRGVIWNDTGMNYPNVIDGWDLKLKDIWVYLFNTSDMSNPVDSIQSSADGKYVFEDLSITEYIIEVKKQAGYEFVEKDFGFDEMSNSHINPATGFSDPFTVGVSCIYINAGMKEE